MQEIRDELDVILSVENLSKSFEKLKVLENISFNLQRNMSIAFLGPSGCGKTTMIRIIANLEKDYEGKIERKYSKIGYVFQEPRLIPWKSVLENLKFVCEDEEKIMDVLKVMKVDKYAGYLPAKLSGGMRQRVNLARALVTEPDILFLDEPFASLDIHTKIDIINDLNKRREEKRYSMIIVTHDIKEAMLLADKIILLSDKPSTIIGEFITAGVPKTISDETFQKIESKILSEVIRRWSAV
ncbi:ABC transporter ATP-binding protein [Fervidobacterium nodosum]|uniref:ABC transporter related n=1 Tax=Fervidobacterium nodosum (strain ATCC 35602 / DSM 5306 / Rt17-B1) TaxID=381764 RepID=A7HJM7_FERNB|nr:ABC transporter ATP-binding protein [Fervidobacterium nodosum]ABS60110.1 ABC transporter related [Fervidobacterium nodosum Rt17-B1]